ncbi:MULTISPECIES: alpha/beta fold hydrolase [Nostocales]|uniref:Alpha/beta fold hydrolase n=3 Tax=Nostocales TaxID=1161 RepID=A0A8S9TCV9_9CYAN|nr:alpha/beta fold hydrolase [Tolypothrix bouteillei]KAF3890026.1 alpha/beta fold hydrolase [Tolypothrix bouteillei VB521301]
MNVTRDLSTESLSLSNSLQTNNGILSNKEALLVLSQNSFSSYCSALTHSTASVTSQEFVSQEIAEEQTQRELPGEIAGDIANWGLTEDGSEAKPRYYKDGVHLYRFDANGRTYQGIEYAKETILVIHGWKNSSDDEIFRNLQQELAKQNPSKQVLALDWREPANHDEDKGLQPKYTSGSVAPVAQWAARTLNNLEITARQLSVVGFSLGAYVAAEIGFLLGKVAHLTALDPANEASSYDIDGNTFGQQKPKPFGDVAYESLAVVVSDESGGFAGDNNYAATANSSFLLRFRGDNWNEYDRNVKYHTGVVEVYTDFISRQRSLPAFESNRFDNNGGNGSIHEGCFNINRRDEHWYEDGFDYFSGSTQLRRWV